MKGCVSNDHRDVDMLRKLTCLFKLWPIRDLRLSHWLSRARRSLIGPNGHQWESWSMVKIAGMFLIGHKSKIMLTYWANSQLSGQLINRLSGRRTSQLLFVNTESLLIFFDFFDFFWIFDFFVFLFFDFFNFWRVGENGMGKVNQKIKIIKVFWLFWFSEYFGFVEIWVEEQD